MRALAATIFFVFLFVTGLLMFWTGCTGCGPFTSDSQHDDVAGIFGGAVFLLFSCLFMAMSAYNAGKGSFGEAEEKLRPGQTFTCLSEPFRHEGNWYAIIRTKKGALLAVCFESNPPVQGVVSKEGGDISFLSFTNTPLVDDPESVKTN